MSLRGKSAEIHRLISAFEVEAAKFHAVRFSTFFVTQDSISSDKQFISPSHTVMLWQYYGRIAAGHDAQTLMSNIQESDLQWGFRGAELSSFAVIEALSPPCS
jgi:hypothetical protein